MYAIEFFVGRSRGGWARGLRRYATCAQAEATVSADWQTEARDYTGVFLRRVVRA